MNDTTAREQSDTGRQEGAFAPGQSFADFFATEIAPGLPALESQRRDRLRKATVRAVGLGFVLAVVAAAAVALPDWRIILAVLVVLGLIAGAFWVTAPARRQREAVREFTVEPLRRYLGGLGGNLAYHRKPGDRFDLDLVERSGIVGGFNRSKLEDLLSGRHRDTDYAMVEARLKRRSSGRRSGSTMVFKGLLCSLSVPAAFSCRVLLVGEPLRGMGGALGNRVVDFLRDKFTALTPVPLDHGAFEDRFQVYSDDPAEARRLLQPGLLDSLLAIADDAGKESVNCAFLEGCFVIALPQKKDLFEIGRLTRSLDHAEADLRRLALEFTIPQRLIENLHGERVAVLG